MAGAEQKYGIKIGLRVALLFLSLCLSAWLLIKEYYMPGGLVFLTAVLQAWGLYRSGLRSYRELDQFVESIRYKDFSRHFDVNHAPAEVQTLRQGFNDINSAFRVISKEKETQYQYLQKMLELVDTGILSYRLDDGEVQWMNESLKKMLQLPYLRTIHILEKKNPVLYQSIISLKPGVSNIVAIDADKLKVVLSATAFQTDGQGYKLVAFQNVNAALDETEAKAWQKLLSVMTHEIMNSVAPISSLAQTLKQRLKTSAPEMENRSGAIDDIELGIDTIQRRSEGLLKFAETYRNLNKITTPNLQDVLVRDLFEHLLQLMHPTLEQKNIEVDTILKDTSLRLQADKHLIEQVLINLLVNAMEAVKDQENSKIILSAYRNSEQKTIIKITDNGGGISPEVMEKIFIPFFSTKKNGSGIGLSLCKQIMLLHKGNIFARSEPGLGTAFLLQF